MPTAFVTGCATGFGHRLAARLLDLGWRVIATDPSVEGWPEALGAPRAGLEVHAVDVRDAASIERALAAAGDLDLLVNNAGVALFATVEEADLEAVRDLFDVNVLGVMRVTQAALPMLRRTRGTLVMLSSLAGRTTFPESGFYAATKHAVEALSEALAQEVVPLGVRLRVVEPGSFDTQFLSRAAEKSAEPPAASPYAGLRDRWQRRRHEVLLPPQDPSQVVDAIVASLDDPAPVKRVVVGADAERILALREALGPDAWWRLAADRAGLEAPHERSGSGLVPGPAELLALPVGDPRWARARLADQHGHLGHWEESAEGRAALERLRTTDGDGC